ncbi:hypothetical protein BH24ACT20_BH24ACT20_07740 [soil metagenome]
MEGYVPYSVIEDVEHKRRKSAGYGDGMTVDGMEAFLSIGGYTDITLDLITPHALNGFRPTKPVDTIHLSVDDPKNFLKKLEERMTTTHSEKQHL